MSNPGKMLIISGPSGAGKNSIIKKIMELDSSFIHCMSVTTREPRGNEEDGVDYVFITEEKLNEMIKNKELLECAQVHGAFYGITKNFVERMALEGRNIVLNIDWQGAKIIKERSREAVYSIFIMPPSIEELKRRLATCGRYNEEEMAKRLAKLESEVSHKNEYDAIIINDDLNVAANEIIKLVRN